MISLIIATRNRHKVQEIQAILAAEAKCLSLLEFPNAPELIEDGNTFAENATKKAVQFAKWLARTDVAKGFVLADDSGLEVDALGGEPGVHSARFAALHRAANSADKDNNAKLLRLLKGVPPEKRTARFRCVLALAPIPLLMPKDASPVCEADETELSTELFSGACEGKIIDSPRGAHGFGYDPLFVPEGFSETFAELGESTKNQISHRSRALGLLKAHLTQHG